MVSEEADGAQLWLDPSIAAQIVTDREAVRLLDEAAQLTAIFTASRDTAKRNLAVRKE